jgi:2-methylisocitrate lyase-like PEP mutase family enzyme
VTPSPRTRLRERLAGGQLLVLPGAANALGARIIEDTGHEAVYVTGAGVANTFLGVPDIGLLGLPELAAHVAAIRGAVELPLVVDADTGFGNALSVHHTVQVLERAGADAIQIEDQTFPKRCGHFAGKEVVAREEMCAKVAAAVAARRDADLVVIARTDARAVHGLDDACARANAYRDAGADVVFVEAPETEHEVELVAARVAGPQVINQVEGGMTPMLPVERLQALGFAVALHANLALLASVAAMRAVLAELRATGSTQNLTTPLASWDERQRLVRKPWFDELAARSSGT